MLVVPLLMLQNGSDASASVNPSPGPTAAVVHRAAIRPAVRLTVRPAAHLTARPAGHHAAGPATHSATHPAAPAAPAPVPIAASPVRKVVPTTTTTSTVPPRPITTNTRVPATTTTTTRPPPVAGNHVETTGIVTYYAHPAGRCASPWLPFGTAVRVTNPANGYTVICVVDDREADKARSIDLSTATFAEIAPLWQGVVDARLSW